MDYVVLVEEPGRDTRALPGTSPSVDAAMKDKVDFPANPGVLRFLIAQVVTTVGLRCLPV